MKLTYVLAVDPGKMTGLALVRADASQPLPVVEWSTELLQGEYAAPIRRTLDWWLKRDTNEDFVFEVVCERFTINAQTAKNSAAPYSLEQIGILKQLCMDYSFPVEKIAFQSPADAKKMFENKTLQALGTWHRGGAGHANDAIRHGLLRLVRVGWKPTVLLEQE